MTAESLAGSVGPLIRTRVPGPRSTSYLEQQAAHESNARTYPRRLPVAVRRAYGPYLEDVDGNVFIDFLTGAGALPLGHSHPEVVAAVERQLRSYVHGLDLPSHIRSEFTRAHQELLPPAMHGRMKIHFCGPTGANAVEAALKLCKVHTGESTILSFQGAFHGSTHGAMAVSGLVGPKAQVPGRLPDVHFFPYSYCLRCPLDLSPSTCQTNCASYLRNTLDNDFGGIARPAAVILELVQGEGGVVPATKEFVQDVVRTARQRDIPVIVDEIQTGYGRTGSWWAFEQYGIEPDVIVMSKAAGGIGLPVAVIMYDERLDSWAPGAHIGTFRGNHLAFAASVAALGVMRRDQVLDNVVAQGRWLLAALRDLATVHACVGDVRGMGLMVGLEIVDPVTGAVDGGRAAAVQAAALQHGLIIEVGGPQDGVLRLLPPLNISRAVLESAVETLAEALHRTSPDHPRSRQPVPATSAQE